MTVAELIEELQKYPPGAEVRLDFGDGPAIGELYSFVPDLVWVSA